MYELDNSITLNQDFALLKFIVADRTDDDSLRKDALKTALESLKEAKIKVDDVYVIVNRMEGADEALKEEGVTMHSITNVMQITKSLFEQNLVGEDVLHKVQEQIRIK